MRGLGKQVLIVTLIIGFGCGFILANLTSQNKFSGDLSGLENAKSSLETFSTVTNDSLGETDENDQGESLTKTELEQAIIYADNNKGDLKLQRDLGLALFQYSLLKKNSDLITDSIRLLERAQKLNAAADIFIQQAIGDGWFILGRQNKLGNFERARKSYLKGLEIDRNNSDLLVGIGQTYLYQGNSDPTTAIKHFKKALEINPRHEKSLESLVETFIIDGKFEQAQSALDKLRQLNPENVSIENLQLTLLHKKTILSHSKN